MNFEKIPDKWGTGKRERWGSTKKDRRMGLRTSEAAASNCGKVVSKLLCKFNVVARSLYLEGTDKNSMDLS